MMLLILDGIVLLLFIGMAIEDTGNYTKHGPRELLVLFIMLWVLGFISGVNI